MAEGVFIQLDAKDGGWVSINPTQVRAVVAAGGGGTLIWFGHGHEAVLREEPDVVCQKLGLDVRGRAAN